MAKVGVKKSKQQIFMDGRSMLPIALAPLLLQAGNSMVTQNGWQ
jgi:hypothetical protein